MTSCLVGKYVFHSDGEYYQIGVIVAALDSSVLVRWMQLPDKPDKPDHESPQRLVSVDQLCDEEIDGHPAWGFFDDRESLYAYLKYLNDGPPDAVVRLVRDKKPER
jgi:hypothetical protein